MWTSGAGRAVASPAGGWSVGGRSAAAVTNRAAPRLKVDIRALVRHHVGVSADPAKARARREFLLRHSGRPELAPQCLAHPPLASMTAADVARTMREEIGLSISRWWLIQMCRRLGVELRSRRGPLPTATREHRLALQRERYRRWAARVRADPVRYAELQRRWKAAYERRRSSLR
jgi:hypothetical protein